MPVLPVGQRRTDPPPGDQPLRWRLALIVRKYPVMVGLLLAVAMLTYPVTLLIGAQADLRGAQGDVEESRLDAAAASCESRNGDRRAIISYATEQAQAQYDAPTYDQLPLSVRTYIEAETSKSLDRLKAKLPLVKDCRAYAEDLIAP